MAKTKYPLLDLRYELARFRPQFSEAGISFLILTLEEQGLNNVSGLIKQLRNQRDSARRGLLRVRKQLRERKTWLSKTLLKNS